MKHQISLWFLVVALGALVAGTAAADCGRGHGSEGKRGQWLEGLNLSAEQKTDLDEIRTAYHAKKGPLKEEMHKARENLREALKGDTSEAELKKMHSNLQKKHQEMGTLRFEKILKIRAILTPEQRQKFEGMRHHRKHKAGHPGSGKHPGPGPKY